MNGFDLTDLSLSRYLYHPGLLILKLQPSIIATLSQAQSSITADEAQNFSHLLDAANRSTSSVRSRGEAAFEAVDIALFPPFDRASLMLFEQAHRIRSVVVLGQTEGADNYETLKPLISAVEDATSLPETDPNYGVIIVELENDRDVPAFQSIARSDIGVRFVSRVPIRYLVQQGTTTNYGALAIPPNNLTLWNHMKIKLADAKARSTYVEPSAIKVAVLDTGVDTNHPDLQGLIARYQWKHPDFPASSSEYDWAGHGTHVAGIISAIDNSGTGISGICQCQLYVWKVFLDIPVLSGPANIFTYVVDPIMYRRALGECLKLGVDVINLSFGGKAPPDPQEQQLIDDLSMKQGTIIVAAMGNERRFGSPTFFPAAARNVIAVGATSIDDNVASFSSSGAHISLCAPGVAIWSPLPTYDGQVGFRSSGRFGSKMPGTHIPRDNDYAALDGTSMAAPHVTAATALLLANKGKLAPNAVQQRLEATADRVLGMGGVNRNPNYGAGRLNVFELLR